MKGELEIGWNGKWYDNELGICQTLEHEVVLKGVVDILKYLVYNSNCRKRVA